MKAEKRETAIDAAPGGFGSLLSERERIDPGDGFETSFSSPPTLSEASEEIKNVAEVIGDSVVYVLAEPSLIFQEPEGASRKRSVAPPVTRSSL